MGSFFNTSNDLIFSRFNSQYLVCMFSALFRVMRYPQDGHAFGVQRRDDFFDDLRIVYIERRRRFV